MSVVETAVREAPATPDAHQAFEGWWGSAWPALSRRSPRALRARLRAAVRDGGTRVLIDLEAVTAVVAAGVAALPEARRVLEAQPSGTLVLRANGVMCRAPKDTGTSTAFALWNRRGI